jgi:hypothetical protein
MLAPARGVAHLHAETEFHRFFGNRLAVGRFLCHVEFDSDHPLSLMRLQVLG